MENTVFNKALDIKKMIRHLEGNTGEVDYVLRGLNIYGVPFEMIKRWSEEYTDWNNAEVIGLKKEFAKL